MHVGREGQSSEQTQYNTGVEEAFFTKSLGCRRSSRRRLLSPIHALHRAHERTARPRWVCDINVGNQAARARASQ